jgi:osmotically-inducible protein OsmY
MNSRGYDFSGNESEGAVNPLNPGVQADSSIRGSDLRARERNWNHNPEPFDPADDSEIKADSSIRGGSIEARGFRSGQQQSSSPSERNSKSPNLSSVSQGQAELNSESSGLASDSNWNPSDDLMRDGLGNSQSDEIIHGEFDSDASLDGAAVGGPASSEAGSSSSHQKSDQTSKDVCDDGSHLEDKASELNSSNQLEQNISGEYDLSESSAIPDQEMKKVFENPGYAELSPRDPNASDTFDSSLSSSRSTDLIHDYEDAVGGAATAESGEGRSETTIESKDFRLQGEAASGQNEYNWLYKDNRAHGIGSLATGESGAPGTSQSESSTMNDDQLAQKVKATLTKESTGVHGAMPREIARNVQVTANGGTVTLKGSVPTDKDKQLIEVRTGEIAGVRQVNNHLTVNSDANHSTVK